MVSRTLGIIALAALLLSFVGNSAFAGIKAQARVDRTTITSQDTLNLTVQINDAGNYATPDLSALKKDFDILGSNQNSRHSIINGSRESSTEWHIGLHPKRTGVLTIPSIRIDGARTQVIQIKVNPATPNAGELQPIFLESSISHSSGYPQQQLVYTLRIFNSIQLRNPSLSELEIENASVKQLEQNSFRRQLNGTAYSVTEISYAIFAQLPGELTIPAQTFSAHQVRRRSNSFFNQLDQGSMLRRLSESKTITIKEPPAAFSASHWLPASDIKLIETWSSNPRELHVGESITRTVTIRGESVQASQLPPIAFPTLAGARLYPDQGETESEKKADGFIAIRRDSTAIIPTREGTLELPAIELQWWDTDSNSMKTASIASSSLNVKPSLEQGSRATPLGVDHSTSAATVPAAEVITIDKPLWRWLSLILLLLWLTTTAAYLRLRRQLQQPASKNYSDSAIDDSPSERQALKILSKACRSADITHVRPALIDWARAYWPSLSINSLQDIQQACGNSALHASLMQLDNQAYGNRADSSKWNSESLLSAIKLLKRSGDSTTANPQAALPRLYR